MVAECAELVRDGGGVERNQRGCVGDYGALRAGKEDKCVLDDVIHHGGEYARVSLLALMHLA